MTDFSFAVNVRYAPVCHPLLKGGGGDVRGRDTCLEEGTHRHRMSADSLERTTACKLSMRFAICGRSTFGRELIARHDILYLSLLPKSTEWQRGRMRFTVKRKDHGSERSARRSAFAADLGRVNTAAVFGAAKPPDRTPGPKLFGTRCGTHRMS